MSDTKAAPYFKNKHREHDDEDLEAHMPQYQNLGIEPEKNPSGKVPFHTKIAKNVELSSDNTTRSRRDTIIPVPYATPGEHKTFKIPLLNVGNNNEQAWMSDGFLDDISELDPNAQMIDNNEFLSESAFELPGSTLTEKINFSTKLEEPEPQVRKERTTDRAPSFIENNNDNNVFSLLSSMEDNLFLLFVSGVPLCSGPLKEIEEQAYSLFVGEHSICAGVPVPIEDILVVKKVGIKVGLFFDKE